MAIARTREDRFEHVLKSDRRCAHQFGVAPCLATGKTPCDRMIETCLNFGCFEHETPEPQRTIFVLRPLTWPENTQVKRYAEHNDNAGAVDYVLRNCLIDWRNFRDVSGDEVVFARHLVDGNDRPNTAVNLERLDPGDMATELFVEIITRGQVNKDERRN